MAVLHRQQAPCSSVLIGFKQYMATAFRPPPACQPTSSSKQPPLRSNHSFNGESID